jgi:hypothetical protein
LVEKLRLHIKDIKDTKLCNHNFWTMMFGTTRTLLALSVVYANLWVGAAFLPQPPSSPPSTRSSSSNSRLYDLAGKDRDVNLGNVNYQSPMGSSPGMTGGGLSVPPTGDMVGLAYEMQSQFDTSTLNPITVQGGSLRTWSYNTPDVERVICHLNTEENRFMEATIQLCQGPDNTPQGMKVTVGKGKIRPFKVVIEAPGGNSAIFIRNRGPLEFPLTARVGAHTVAPIGGPGGAAAEVMPIPLSIYHPKPGSVKVVQGGAVHSRGLDARVECCKVIINTDGRPLNAKIELIQGPEANKYVIDVYTEDGQKRPFCALLQTPGVGNTIRIVNTAPVEFPMFVSLEPCSPDGFGGFTQDAISKGPGSLWENGGNGAFNRF